MMEKRLENLLRKFLQDKQKRNKWLKIVAVLASFVVFVTVYALILPGSAWTGEKAETTTAVKEATAGADGPESKKEEKKEEEETEEKTTVAKAETESDTSKIDKAETKTTEQKEQAEGQTEEKKETGEQEEKTKEEKKEEAKEAEPAGKEEDYKAGKLTYEGTDYIITAEYGKEAKIPEGAKLVVKEIKENNDKEQYESYLQKTKNVLNKKSNEKISFARFFDISFIVDKEEIEPSAKVKVKVSYDKKVNISDDIEVKSVHFGKKTEVLDVKTNEKNGRLDQVTFDANNFSVYAIVGVEKTTGNVEGIANTQTETIDNITFNVSYSKSAGLPEGTKLVVKEVSANDYSDATADILGDVEIVGEKYFDISFKYDGEAIEPKDEVNVEITMSGDDRMTEGNGIKVVHFEDGAEKPEIIDSTVEGGKVEEEVTDSTEAAASVKSNEFSSQFSTNNSVKSDEKKDIGSDSVVTFKSDNFSVYGVIETGDTSKPKEYRRTYSFYYDDYVGSPDTGTPYTFDLENNPTTGTTATKTTTNQQIVKAGEVLKSVGIPEAKVTANEGKEFLGWEVVAVDGVSDLQVGQVITLPREENTTTKEVEEKVTLKAHFGTDVILTFYDSDNTTVIYKEKVAKDSVVDLSVYHAAAEIPASETQMVKSFVGWNTSKNANQAINNSYTATEDQSFYPVYKEGYWLYFNANDSDNDVKATFTESVFANKGETSELKPSDPERQGYTFDEWYTDQGCTKEFSWGTELTGNTNLYAKWNPANTTYKIVIWRQRVTDDRYAEDAAKTYDYGESVTVNATTGDMINGSTSGLEAYKRYSTGNYKGFRFASAGVSRTDSTTTVNVAGDGSTVINIYYDRDLITINFKYSRSRTVTWTGLYGQPFSQYNYSWPADDGPWYGVGTERYMSFLGQFMLPDNDNGSVRTTETFEKGATKGGTVYFYLQNIDGSWPSTPSATGSLTQNSGNFRFTEKFDNFEVSAYQLRNQGSGTEGDWTPTHNGGSVNMNYASSLGVKYSRKKYNVEYYNGSKGHIENKDVTKYYEASLSDMSEPTLTQSDYPGNTSEANSYNFVGWFADPEGTTHVSFGSELSDDEKSDLQTRYPDITNFVTYETMPGHNLPVYAGWKAIKHIVTFNPNGGTIPGLKIGENYVESVLLGNSVRNATQSNVLQTTYTDENNVNYTLVGWYKVNNDGSETLYNFGDAVTADITLKAHWRQNGQFYVRYVDSDENQNKEIQVDTVAYADQSDVKVMGWPTGNNGPKVKDGYVFAGWQLKTTTTNDDGTTTTTTTTYTPGQTFTMDAKQAVEDSLTIGGETKIVKFITLKALYTQLGTTYITYDANEGSGTLTDPSGIGNNTQANVPLNQTITLSKGDGFTREGYVLVGWNTNQTKANFGEVEWNLGEKVGINDKQGGGYLDDGGNKLYAVWRKPINIKKVSSTDSNTILSGAKFNLTKLSNSTYVNVTAADFYGNVPEIENDGYTVTSTDSTVALGVLKAGEYKLTENKVPDGYIVQSIDTIFTVGADGKVTLGSDQSHASLSEDKLTITIKNKPGEALPSTGGSGTTLYTLGGLSMITFALMAGFVLRRKREGRFDG